MQEDPAAKRNRGNPFGGLILLVLVAALVVLAGVYVFRPARPVTPPDPEPVAQSVDRQVASELAADQRRESGRAPGAAPDPLIAP